jgi:hypothetical protein
VILNGVAILYTPGYERSQPDPELLAASECPRRDTCCFYRDPQSGWDTVNRSISHGKALPYTLHPEPFYPLLYPLYPH